jgi:hypothetical protein
VERHLHQDFNSNCLDYLLIVVEAGWGSLPPAPGLTARACSSGREFAARFFELHLAATPCVFPAVAVIGSDWLLSSSKILTMLGQAVLPARRPPGCNMYIDRRPVILLVFGNVFHIEPELIGFSSNMLYD